MWLSDTGSEEGLLAILWGLWRWWVQVFGHCQPQLGQCVLWLGAAAGIAAAMEQRLGWQISPRGSDLRLLPLLKYFQHVTLSTTRFKGLV